MTHSSTPQTHEAWPPAATRYETGPVLLAVKPERARESDGVSRLAHWIAEHEGSELHVVSVLDLSVDFAAAATGVAFRREEYEQEMTTIAAALWASVASGEQGGADRVDVLEGNTARTITTLALNRGANLIVIGTGRHGVLGRFLYGERALEVVRHSRRPVLVVPPTAQPPLRRAAVAVDFSPASLRAATWALGALAPGGSLALVHVQSALRLGEDSIGWWEDTYEERTVEMFARFRSAMQQQSDISIETRLLPGDPVDTLLGYVGRQGIDLLACGRLRHPMVERLLVGSVSAALVRRAPCSVLVAPEQPHDAPPPDA